METPAADINYFLGIDATGHLVADFEEASTGATPGLNHPVVGLSTIPNGEWHHVAATYDGTTMAVYLDGVVDRSLAIGQPPNTAGTPPVEFAPRWIHAASGAATPTCSRAATSTA